MDPVTIITAIGELANAAAQYQAGQLSPEQLATAWSEAVGRVTEANAAWEAAVAPQKPPV